MGIDQRLESLGISLPAPPEPAGSYAPTVISGRLLYVSGQIPMRNGEVAFTGRVADQNLDAARESARLCAVNILAQTRKALGSLDCVSQIVKLSGFVNSLPGFARHAEVINPASDLMVEVFGERGVHSRIAVGAASLPFDSMTEICAVIEFSRPCIS